MLSSSGEGSKDASALEQVTGSASCSNNGMFEESESLSIPKHNPDVSFEELVDKSSAGVSGDGAVLKSHIAGIVFPRSDSACTNLW